MKPTLTLCTALLLAPLAVLHAADPAPAEVVIYGATPGGIAAALAAARNGRSVVLAEPTHRIGGMATCGLSHHGHLHAMEHRAAFALGRDPR